MDIICNLPISKLSMKRLILYVLTACWFPSSNQQIYLHFPALINTEMAGMIRIISHCQYIKIPSSVYIFRCKKMAMIDGND